MKKKLLLFLLPGMLLIQSVCAQTQKTSIRKDIFKNFRLDIGGGQSTLMASTSEAISYLSGLGVNSTLVTSYYNTLTKGNVLDAGLHYMYSPKYGYGIKYQFNNSQSAIPGYVEVTDNSYNYYGQISENIITNYVGISFVMTEPIISNGKLSYKLQSSIGPVFYRDESLFIISKSLLSAVSGAVTVSGSLQYKLTDKLSLGLSLNLFASTLSSIHVQNVANEPGTDSKANESLNRANWLAYLAFNL